MTSCPGITRRAILEIARDAGYDVAERRIDRSELYLADEVFLTGTGAQVAPVASIDDRPVGDPAFPIALDIQARYFAAVRGTDARYAHWLTPICSRSPSTMTVSPAELPDPEADASPSSAGPPPAAANDTSRANLTLVGGGHRWRANAGGNGAVDALMRAVDSALAPLLGEGVTLVSYDVHAAGVRARGEGFDRRRRSPQRAPPTARSIPGSAVHDNVLQASVEAYVEAIAALLADEGVDIAASVPSPGDTDRHETDPDHRSGAKDKIMSAYNS